MPMSVTTDLYLTLAAQRDLEAIWEYSAGKWGEGQADSFIRRLDEAFGQLSAFPESGRDVSELRQGYRTLAVSEYRIFYRLLGAEIEIVRILHGHMDVVGLIGPGGD